LRIANFGSEKAPLLLQVRTIFSTGAKNSSGSGELSCRPIFLLVVQAEMKSWTASFMLYDSYEFWFART
jgi:hypothetical protein